MNGCAWCRGGAEPACKGASQVGVGVCSLFRLCGVGVCDADAMLQCATSDLLVKCVEATSLSAAPVTVAPSTSGEGGASTSSSTESDAIMGKSSDFIKDNLTYIIIGAVAACLCITCIIVAIWYRAIVCRWDDAKQTETRAAAALCARIATTTTTTSTTPR